MISSGQASALAALLFASLGSGCATEESVTFGEPSRVTGGHTTTGTASASSSGGGCAPDGGCTVHFATDVYAAILDGTARCTAGPCHGSAPVLGMQIPPGDAKAAREALLAYTLEGVGPYVTPCDPAASSILCNMKLDADAGTNPHGSCGSTMPKAGEDTIDDQPLTQPQLDAVATWIACGAADD